jgi:hypothetical protein
MAVKQIFNTSAELDFPNVLPTLDLDFANSKTLDPRIDFTRASGGSYVGADGLIKYAGVNEARFDHDPVTGESLGLLVEESRTNLLTRSEEFNDASWGRAGLHLFGSGSVANAIVAPDGLTTADLITENTATSQRNVQQVSTTIGTKTLSVFAKQGPGSRLLRLVDFNLTDGAQGETYFNLSTGTVVSGSGTIQAFPNGWYRCSIQTTTTVTSTYFISLAPSVNIFTYTGDGTSGIYIWGAQLEAGAFPTSYIPTQGSTRTRASDNASITGKNFSEWYRQDEGTMFVDYKLITNGSAARVFNIDNGTSNIRISGLCGNTLFQTFILPENRGPSITFPSTFNFKVATVHKDYNVFNYLNGKYFNFETGRTMIIPKTLNTLRIGNWVANTLQGTIIKKLTYFPKRLPNSQLISLTT